MFTKVLPTFSLAVAASLMPLLTADAQVYYENDYHAATAGESYLRGTGDLIRSAGAANMMNARAASELQDANSKYLDNRYKATETYFDMRALNRQARAAENPKPTTEQLFRIAQEAAPDPLSTSQLDPLTGQINWPTALTDEAYGQTRDQIDQLVASRAQNSGRISYSSYTQLKSLIAKLEADLKSNISKYPPQSYTSAKSFLKSLDYELDRAAT